MMWWCYEVLHPHSSRWHLAVGSARCSSIKNDVDGPKINIRVFESEVPKLCKSELYA